MSKKKDKHVRDVIPFNRSERFKQAPANKCTREDFIEMWMSRALGCANNDPAHCEWERGSLVVNYNCKLGPFTGGGTEWAKDMAGDTIRCYGIGEKERDGASWTAGKFIDAVMKLPKGTILKVRMPENGIRYLGIGDYEGNNCNEFYSKNPA